MRYQQPAHVVATLRTFPARELSWMGCSPARLENILVPVALLVKNRQEVLGLRRDRNDFSRR